MSQEYLCRCWRWKRGSRTATRWIWGWRWWKRWRWRSRQCRRDSQTGRSCCSGSARPPWGALWEKQERQGFCWASFVGSTELYQFPRVSMRFNFIFSRLHFPVLDAFSTKSHRLGRRLKKWTGKRFKWLPMFNHFTIKGEKRIITLWYNHQLISRIIHYARKRIVQQLYI